MRLLPFDYAVRNLGRSPTRLALTVSGSVLVVLLVIAAVAFIRGMTASLSITGNSHNVILLGAGSEESIERSQVDLRAAVAATAVSGVRERLGVPYVSPEIHSALAIKTGTGETGTGSPEDGKGRMTVIRGVRSAAYLVHPQVQVIAGRAPEAGRDEVMLGGLVAQKLGVDDAELAVGNTLTIDERVWTISGHFSAARTVMDAEIWMPLSDLQVVERRDTLSCVILTLDPDHGEFEDVAAMAAQRLDLELTAIPESEYYQKLSEFFGPIRIMVMVTAILIGLGGMFGGLNTLYAAFATRVRELGTLQVIGYRRSAIVVTIVQESLVATACGALVASVLGWWLLDGIAVRFSMGAFGLIVDGVVVATGLGAGVLLGLVGALPPAIRCLRLPIGEALKS